MVADSGESSHPDRSPATQSRSLAHVLVHNAWPVVQMHTSHDEFRCEFMPSACVGALVIEKPFRALALVFATSPVSERACGLQANGACLKSSSRLGNQGFCMHVPGFLTKRDSCKPFRKEIRKLSLQTSAAYWLRNQPFGRSALLLQQGVDNQGLHISVDRKKKATHTHKLTLDQQAG